VAAAVLVMGTWRGAQAMEGDAEATEGALELTMPMLIPMMVTDWSQMKAKGKDMFRLVVANIRRVKDSENAGDAARKRRFVEVIKKAKADAVGCVDTGLQDGDAPGQALLWSCGQFKERLREWGGSRLLWDHKQGAKSAGAVYRGGVGLALH
jgi:hypothetical protein